jgi:hypothetical protein
MSIMTSMRTVLSGDATLTAITTQIYPGSVPIDGTYPAVVFNLEDDEDDETLEGVGNTKLATISIDCWDHTLLTAESMASAVKDLLVPWYGTFGDNTVTNIAKVRELHLQENDTLLNRVALQFQLLYGD